MAMPKHKQKKAAYITVMDVRERMLTHRESYAVISRTEVAALRSYVQKGRAEETWMPKQDPVDAFVAGFLNGLTAELKE